MPIETRHVVYADEKEVLCWLWNHRDAAKTAIGPETKRVIFFIDAADGEGANEGVALLRKMVGEIGGFVIAEGLLHRNHPFETVEVSQ